MRNAQLHDSSFHSQPKQYQESVAVQKKRKFLAFPSPNIR